MGRFILRRLAQAVFTVFSVLLLTFLLFRVIAGDVSASYVNVKLGREARQTFYEKHKLDLPVLVNLHRRMEFIDQSGGEQNLSIGDGQGGTLVEKMGVFPVPREEVNGPQILGGKRIFWLAPEEALVTSIPAEPADTETAATQPMEETPAESPLLVLRLSDGTSLEIPADKAHTYGALMDYLNSHPDNGGKLTARISEWRLRDVFRSQFFWHLWETLTFSGRSYATEQRLLDIIGERARFSLAIGIPALALGWFFGMVVSCFVAYYRGRWIDKAGVFLSVLGMCIPFLAYMIYGQWLMFQIAPAHAFGLGSRANIYVPIGIAVVAGLGGSVRFYRTIILDQVNQDYVRTALAKGVPLPGILFKHVLKNCMLPILTNLVLAIPFLIMGSLLLERFFGIYGLGDLMINSISNRDVPIITGLTFLTAVIYVVGLLVTDLLYAVFDPRVRLR